jgi:hypothetical protein
MSKTPQVVVSLTPQGGLKVELPGIMATRRSIEIRTAEAGETLLRILLAQQQDQTEIGLDGAPTGQQLKHWERHAVWPSSSCRFCLAEGRATAAEPKRRSRQLIVEHGDVQVRRIKAKEKGKAKPQVTKKLAGELGL